MELKQDLYNIYVSCEDIQYITQCIKFFWQKKPFKLECLILKCLKKSISEFSISSVTMTIWTDRQNLINKGFRDAIKHLITHELQDKELKTMMNTAMHCTLKPAVHIFISVYCKILVF